MNSRRFWWGLLPVWMVFVFLAGFFVHASARGELQEPPPVAFTYQGRLQEGGQLTEGKYDLRFRLYDSAESGTLIAEDFHEDVDISQGWFSV
ncbi:MAG: hypothetical protein N3A60_13085, partial [Thermanaerothrix sp.]|nr:hypothetical protein [Thermanaerothrix sp.]